MRGRGPEDGRVRNTRPRYLEFTPVNGGLLETRPFEIRGNQMLVFQRASQSLPQRKQSLAGRLAERRVGGESRLMSVHVGVRLDWCHLPSTAGGQVS